MPLLGVISLHRANLLWPRNLHQARKNNVQEWRRKEVFRASWSQELSDVDEVQLAVGEDLELDSSVFEDVFKSVERVEKPVRGRMRGLPNPQSTLIPDDWKLEQEYFHRGKKERKKETLALELNWAKKRALRERATQEEIENEQRFLRGEEFVLTDVASADEVVRHETQEEQVEDLDEVMVATNVVSGRARPKDYRSELQFRSFDDIVKNLKQEEVEARQVEAEQDNKMESEDAPVAVKEQKITLTAEEKAMLKNKNLDFSRISSAKWCPLHTLAACGQVYLAAELLKRDVLIDHVDNEGLTPLHRAVQSGRKTMIRLLLKAGANVHVLDREGATLLHYSAQIGNHEISKSLLRHGVPINVADKDGWTPLHVAVQSGRLELVKALVNRGADVSLANKDGNTALDLALSFGGCFNFYDAIKFLKKKSIDFSRRSNSVEDDEALEP